MLIEQAAQDSANIVFKNQLALLHSLKQLAAQAINSLALLVHHVVILKQVFARFKILRFNGLLRALNAIREHLRFDGHALFHSESFKERADPLLGEDAHQVVFK